MGSSFSNQSYSQPVNIDLCIKDIKQFEFIEKIKFNRFLKVVSGKYRRNNYSKDIKCLSKLYAYNYSDVGIINQIIGNFSNLSKLLSEYTNILIYDKIFMTDKLCVAIRPHIQHNLYDRLSCRPFLTTTEKVWILYQTMRAVELAHAYTIHGDLKLENVLLTSWNFVILSDFSFNVKPSYLAKDLIVAEFNYFFDSSGRHSCALAPERFDFRGHSETSESPLIENESFSVSKNELNQLMDIFSLGCLTYELFTDGKILFQINDLITYSKDHLPTDDIKTVIKNEINIPAISNMVSNMTDWDPYKRHPASYYIQNNTLFDKNFNYFYDISIYISKNCFSPESTILFLKNELNFIVDHSRNDFTGMFIVLNICSSCVTSLSYDASKIDLMNILFVISSYFDASIIYNRIITYLLYFSNDNCDLVRVSMIDNLVKILNLAKSLREVENINLFADFILQKLQKMIVNSSIFVRIKMALQIPTVYSECMRFIRMVQQIIKSDSVKYSCLQSELDFEMEQALLIIKQMNKQFLIDQSSLVQSIYIENSLKRMSDLIDLVLPFDEAYKDLILSHIITMLNHKNWKLRKTFYDVLSKIISTYQPTITDIIVPLLYQGLFDTCEWVVISALQSISRIFSSDILNGELKFSLFHKSLPLLIHPNPSIRTSSSELVSSYFESKLSNFENNAARTELKNYLKDEAHSITKAVLSKDLISVVIQPIPFRIFDVLLNRESSSKFLDFLQQNSSLIMQGDYMTGSILNKSLYEHGDVVDSFLKLLASNGLNKVWDLRKFLLASTYIKSYNKEKPNLESLIEDLEAKNSHTLRILTNEAHNCINLDLECDYALLSKLDSKHLESNFGLCPKETYFEYKKFIFDTRKHKRLYRENIDKILSIYMMKYQTYKNACKYIKDYSPKKVEKMRKHEKIGQISFVSRVFGHSDKINQISLVEKTTQFSSCSDDCTVKLWDSSLLDSSQLRVNYEPKYVYNQMTGRIDCVRNICSFSGSRLRIACSSSDDSDIQIFDANVGTGSDKSKVPFSRCLVDINRDGFTVDLNTNSIYESPQLLAAMITGCVLGFDTRDSNRFACLRLESDFKSQLTCLECDPFGCWVAAGSKNGSIYLWDVRFPIVPVSIAHSIHNDSVTKIKVDSTSTKRIIVGFRNSVRPVSIFNLQTCSVEAAFSSYNQDNCTCTGLTNVEIDNSLHVFFSTSDAIVRDWNVTKPNNSSILVPSHRTSGISLEIDYFTHAANSKIPCMTKESLLKTTKVPANVPLLPKNYLSNFCTDLTFIPQNKMFVFSFFDGSIDLYK